MGNPAPWLAPGFPVPVPLTWNRTGPLPLPGVAGAPPGFGIGETPPGGPPATQCHGTLWVAGRGSGPVPITFE